MNIKIGHKLYTLEESEEIEFVKKEITELGKKQNELYDKLIETLKLESSNTDTISQESMELFDYIFNDYVVEKTEDSTHE